MGGLNSSEGLLINFPGGIKPEQIKGDIFWKMNWLDLCKEQEKLIQGASFTLNGVARTMRVVGWQGSDNGMVGKHNEDKLQEDVHVPAGHVVMAIFDQYGGCRVEEARGFIPMSELAAVHFALKVVADGMSGLEHLALMALGSNFTGEIPRLTTGIGMAHATMVPENSWYLVTKHQPA